MQHRKLAALLSALALGASLPALGQTGAAPLAQAQPAPYRPSEASPPPQAVVPAQEATLPAAPQPRPDPTADEKCRFVAPNDYWDCMNAHNGQ